MIFLQFWSVDNVILIILFLLYTETEYIENIVSIYLQEYYRNREQVIEISP